MSDSPGLAIETTLAKLKHLDVTGLIEDQEWTACGGYSDVFEGFLVRRTARGPGGYSRVKVAIKRIRIHLMRDQAFAKSLAKEIGIWSKLVHNNIVRLEGFVLEGPFPSLVSIWAGNGSVIDYIKKHQDCDLMSIIIGIAEGLGYIHSNGVIHSDLKSDNVLMNDLGQPMICDFGLSRMMSYSRSILATTSHKPFRGTIRWMAYELLKPDEDLTDAETSSETILSASEEIVVQHTRASDMLKCALNFKEILTCSFPYAHIKNDIKVVLAICNKEVPRKPLLSEPLKEQLWQLCMRCWVHIPEQRITIQNTISCISGIASSSLALQRTSRSGGEEAYEEESTDRAQGVSDLSYPPLSRLGSTSPSSNKRVKHVSFSSIVEIMTSETRSLSDDDSESDSSPLPLTPYRSTRTLDQPEHCPTDGISLMDSQTTDHSDDSMRRAGTWLSDADCLVDETNLTDSTVIEHSEFMMRRIQNWISDTNAIEARSIETSSHELLSPAHQTGMLPEFVTPMRKDYMYRQVDSHSMDNVPYPEQDAFQYFQQQRVPCRFERTSPTGQNLARRFTEGDPSPQDAPSTRPKAYMYRSQSQLFTQRLKASDSFATATSESFQRRVRIGFWNRRGDFLTQSGHVVFCPPQRQYPPDLADYPEDAFCDHFGRRVSVAAGGPPSPTMIAHTHRSVPCERSYDTLVKYISVP